MHKRAETGRTEVQGCVVVRSHSLCSFHSPPGLLEHYNPGSLLLVQKIASFRGGSGETAAYHGRACHGMPFIP